MENDYPECGKLKIFRQETRFLSDKIAEKADFASFLLTKYKKWGKMPYQQII